jgi:hypothetical protein
MTKIYFGSFFHEPHADKLAYDLELEYVNSPMKPPDQEASFSVEPCGDTFTVCMTIK